jgi:hypothetical protein
MLQELSVCKRYEKKGGHNVPECDITLCFVFMAMLNYRVVTTVSNFLCPQNLTSMVCKFNFIMHLLHSFVVNSEDNPTVFIRNITFSSLLCTLGFESFKYPPSMRSTEFQMSPIIQGLIILKP